MDKTAFQRWADEWRVALASPDVDWDRLFTEVDETPPTSVILSEAAAMPPGPEASSLLGLIDISTVTAEEALQLAGRCRWRPTRCRPGRRPPSRSRHR